MKKFLQKKLKDQKGMTLIELLAVIVILAIIAAIAIPAIGNIIENSRIDAVKSDASNVLHAASLFEAQEGSIAALTTSDVTTAGEITVDELIDKGFLEDAGEIAGAAVLTDGPALSGTVTIGDGTLTFSDATTQDVNDAASATEIRKALEAEGNAHTIGTVPAT